MPLIDEIIHRSLGEQRVSMQPRSVSMPPRIVSVDAGTEMIEPTGHQEGHYESRVEVVCRFWSTPEEFEHRRRQAVKMIMHRIYDPLPIKLTELKMRLGPVDDDTRALLDEIESIITF